jgi:hypothetical protein
MILSRVKNKQPRKAMVTRGFVLKCRSFRQFRGRKEAFSCNPGGDGAIHYNLKLFTPGKGINRSVKSRAIGRAVLMGVVDSFYCMAPPQGGVAIL